MFRIAIALLLAAPLVGQTASVTHYGMPCGSPPLSTQGLPRLGTTLTVSNVRPLAGGGCYPFPICTWHGPTIVIFGTSRGGSVVLGCTILARPDVYLLGDANDEVNLQIPIRASLTGLRFYLQAVTPAWFGLPPSLTLQYLDFSDGVECVIGT